MMERIVQTWKYELDLERLLSRRLIQCGCAFHMRCGADGAHIYLEESGNGALADALSMLLCRDLMYFELAAMTDRMPLTLPEKQQALADALQTPCDDAPRIHAREMLAQYLETEICINLEGYLTFRMRGFLDEWQTLAEQAMAEQLLRREYSELLGVLGAFLETQPPRIGELSVCLHPDGSCTLTDDSDGRIDYVDGSEDGVVSLLVSMAPQRLIVYDLSGGSCRRLTDAIARVFAGRVRIYR